MTTTEAPPLAVYFGLGAGWGDAFAAASRAGLCGQRAVAAVFAVFYATDVALNTPTTCVQRSPRASRSRTMRTPETAIASAAERLGTAPVRSAWAKTAWSAICTGRIAARAASPPR